MKLSSFHIHILMKIKKPKIKEIIFEPDFQSYDVIKEDNILPNSPDDQNNQQTKFKMYLIFRVFYSDQVIYL